MPNSLIKAAAKQLGKGAAELEKIWDKIKGNVSKEKSYDDTTMYKVITKAFLKATGYKPASESIVTVIQLTSENYNDVVSNCLEENSGYSCVVEHDTAKFLVVFSESTPKYLSESCYSYSMNYKYNSFENKFSSVQNVVWKIVDALRDKLPTDKKWEANTTDILNNQAWEILEKVCGLKKTDFDEYSDAPDNYKIMEDDDHTGFVLLQSNSMYDSMAFFYAIWEYNKKLVISLIKEGLMFNSHKYFSYSDLGV